MNDRLKLVRAWLRLSLVVGLIFVPSPARAAGDQGSPQGGYEQVAFNPFPSVDVKLTPKSMEITAAQRVEQIAEHADAWQVTTPPPPEPGPHPNPRPNPDTTYVGPPVVSPFRLPQAGDLIGPCVGDGWMFADTACVAPPPDPTVKDVPGRHNVRTSRVDASVAARQIARALFQDVPLPDIVLGTNPPRGIVNIATWFWVEPASYAGQPIVETAPQKLPWLEWWTVTVEHTSSHPCDDDPTQTCEEHSTSEEDRGPEEHYDLVQAAVQLNPVRYVWAWGDGTEPSPPFMGFDGLGRPYTDPYTPSPVSHLYRQSSAPVFDRGGFEITLTAYWSASWAYQISGDTIEPYQRNGTFADGRVGTWAVRHQVRESQPILVGRTVR